MGLGLSFVKQRLVWVKVRVRVKLGLWVAFRVSTKLTVNCMDNLTLTLNITLAPTPLGTTLTERVDVDGLIFEAESIKEAEDGPTELTVLERPDHNLKR